MRQPRYFKIFSLIKIAQRFGNLVIAPALRMKITRSLNWCEYLLSRQQYGYHDSKISHNVVQATQKLKQGLQNNKNLHLENYRSLLALSYAINCAKSPINVLDFGGSGGGHYFATRNIFPKSINKYFVLETPTMTKSASILSDEVITFISSSDELPLNLSINLLFSSGTLHYTEDPIKQLTVLLSLRPEVVFFTKTLFSNKTRVITRREFSRLSGNGPSLEKEIEKREKKRRGGDSNHQLISYLSTVIPKKVFESTMQQKYEKIFEIDEGVPAGYTTKSGVRMIGSCWKLS
jgi:putative methyltransferase (TIGR04325 family)